MLKIYNSLTQQKEIFQPINTKQINMYVCGVTVYDHCHLGHARCYVAFDVIVRYLRSHNYNVTYVRNITDIDDKIIKRANENGEEINSITQRYTQAMHEDFKALNLLDPDHEPRATEYIPAMITLIQKLLINGCAYIASNGDVYYEVRKFKNYGCLSHHNIDQLESGARIEIAGVKRDPLDFVLWKLAKPNEPAWDSPWGKGRPGWHLECSAMSMQLLGEYIDIHGGGKDLIFPHHENELAQSEGATQTTFVKTWMHAGHLQIEKEKMSKSLGNFFTIRDAIAQYMPEVVRYFFVSSHYRSPLQYSNDLLQQAKNSLERLYTALRTLPIAEPENETSFEENFYAAMDDDFNTPIALSVLFELAHEIHRLRDKDIGSAAKYAALLKKLGELLGILQLNPEVFFQSANKNLDTERIEILIGARQRARHLKNWAEADRIRAELSSMSVELEDGSQGTTWKYIR
ncbi:MAG: cysteine--tRNA ligase [Gammaproteobacteria bacterium RIFCSPHIGHO2_12_FULL_42_13]|nr:MAG: cysteine--tRNA ligase [Gammaproteobacteria bacterium RIFCSPHIGHO2_12_FULL_42_13]